MELAPCPFCGSPEVELVRQTAHFVRCSGCFAEGPPKRRYYSNVDQGEASTTAGAVEAWNNRTASS